MEIIGDDKCKIKLFDSEFDEVEGLREIRRKIKNVKVDKQLKDLREEWDRSTQQSIDDFPPANPKLGTLIFSPEENLVRRWDGEVWVDINDPQKKWRSGREKLTQYVASVDPALESKRVELLKIWENTGNLIYEPVFKKLEEQPINWNQVIKKFEEQPIIWPQRYGEADLKIRIDKGMDNFQMLVDYSRGEMENISGIPQSQEAAMGDDIDTSEEFKKKFKHVLKDSNADHMKALVPIRPDHIDALTMIPYEEYRREMEKYFPHPELQEPSVKTTIENK